MTEQVKAVVCVAVAMGLAACGETTIAGGELEAEITEDAEKQGLVIDQADCPSPEAKEGERFECTVTVKGAERKLEVVQRNDDGNVEYDLTPLLESRSGSDAGGDEAAVRFVIDAVNRDVTALCDYATGAYRRKLGGERCAKKVTATYDEPMREYRVRTRGDRATAAGNGRMVRLERQRDGSWLIVGVT